MSARPIATRAAADALANVGVTEEGENRGKFVEAYQRAVGIPPGSPWCAAFVRFRFEAAAKAMEVRIRQEAKSIAESYLAPPHTTDFAILFLPTEGLYAEVLRRPGLMDTLQRDYRVTLAGPTTLLAMLNSLHMGFRTLALEQQASEVWKVLGAVKTEFERYGDWVEKVREQVQKAADTLDRADTRSRQMRRALKNVEALPEGEAQALLPKFDDALDDTDAKV